MRVRALLTISLVLGSLNASCNSIATSGNTNTNPDPFCLPETGCTTTPDPNANIDPYNVPGRTGTQSVGGTSMNPFDPKSPGSTGVSTNPAGAIGIDLSGFRNSGAPFIWIANSSEGTESKVNVNTNQEVARYCTYPGCKGDPSRSTVSLQGDVVVANRANYYGYAFPDRASAVKIAGDKSRCVDRNGNGQIDTFEGAGPIPAQFIWPVGQKDSPDECVLWLTNLTKDRNGTTIGAPGTLPRAAAFDASIGADGSLSSIVYIGLFQTQEVVRMDAKTGAILKQFFIGSQPYGFVLDKDGTLWVRGAEGSLTKVDVKNNDTVTRYVGAQAPPCPYGISADARGYIYTAGSTCVSRFNPANPGANWETLNLPAAPGGPAAFARGLALDSKFNLWVADTSAGIYHIDASKDFGQGMTFKRALTPRGYGNDKYYLGIGLDVNEQPWVVSEGAGNLGTPGGTGMIYHVNPADYSVVGVQVGQNPYTYSDMTGAQLRIAGSPFGIYRHTFKSDCAPLKTTWTQVTYDLDTPTGTNVEISGRSAATATALDTALFGPVTSIPPAVPGPYTPNISEGVDNSYLQLQFKLTADAPDKTPLVKNLSAKYICG